MIKKINQLSFEHIILDSELSSLLIRENCLPLLEQFSRQSRIHSIGNDDPVIDSLVSRSKGIKLSDDIRAVSDSVWDSVHLGGIDTETLSKVLNIPRTELRNKVLYLKSTKKQRVLLNRYNNGQENWDKIVKKRGCHLKLASFGVETCSFGCDYCFANYNNLQPTTLLLDSPNRLSEDIKNPQVQDLLVQGTPVYLGSLADLYSPESLLFRIPQRMLKVLQGHRVFTVTKSILVASADMLMAIKSHGMTKVLFTFSSLFGFEKNLPYNSKIFPGETLKLLTDNKIDTVLLYKPIIPNINDKKDHVKLILQYALEAGIKEVSIGFIQMDPEMETSLSLANERLYLYFDQILQDRIRDERIPSRGYREQVVRMFAEICDALGLSLSFCQVHLGLLEAEFETAHCVCRSNRWS